MYVPLLFGDADGKTDGLTKVRNTVGLLASAGWHVLGEREHQPIVDRLRLLCRRISANHNGKPLAVIGMCLTGSLPIALMDEKCVTAPVVAQPSIPFFHWTRKANERLGISDEELARAIDRVNHDPKMDVLGFRYALDKVSSAERFATLHCAFRDRFKCNIVTKDEYDKGGEWHLDKKSHATLTHNWASSTAPGSSACLVPGLSSVPRDYPPSKMFETLIAFLNSKLE